MRPPPDPDCAMACWGWALVLGPMQPDVVSQVYEAIRRARKNRDNGFSLRGLAESLAAQGRDDDAAAVRARLDRPGPTPT